MSKFKLLSMLLCCSTVSVFAQQVDTTASSTPPPPPKQSAPAPSGPSKVYYGGIIGFSFGDYFRISLEPYVAYKVTPKFSLGGKIRYEYIEDKRYDEKLTSSNYGGSVFTRFRPIPRIYAHGEFAYMSYSYKVSDLESERQWVPFLLLGGGLIQRAGARTSLYVEVLWDVLQDDNSPYDSSTPFVSIGVGVGF
ncbi:MAG: hypothetical protein ACREOO_09455 [bacterium]